MPTSNEKVENRDINGAELKKLMLAALEQMLSKDGMFSERLSYPQAAFRIKFQLFIQNPSYPEHSNTTESAPPPKGRMADKSGGRAGLTTPAQLKGAAGTIEVAKQRDQTIDSPNLARVEADMPILVQRRVIESGRIEEVEMNFDGKIERGQYPDLNKTTDKDIEGEEWK